MKGIEGWLEEDEADLLIAATGQVLRRLGPKAVVEIGSYCGRSTVVLGSVMQVLSPESRVYAIDPHDGWVGAADGRLSACGSTRVRFDRNIADAGLTEVVV